MADEPPRPGWPQAPQEVGSARPAGLPPSAPPPGWTGAPPSWGQPTPPAPPAPVGGGLPRPPRRPGRLRGRRVVVIAGGAALVLLAVVALVVSGRGGGEGGGGRGGGQSGGGGRSSAPAAAAGRELSLLDGRLIVVAPEGWEQRDSSPDTASVKVELRLPGRDLVATLVASALPPGGSLDDLLTAEGATRFEVVTKDAGPLQAAAVPATGSIRAGALRPNATFFFTLSVFALDGQPLDGPLLQRLFTEQVASQLRIP